MVGCQQRVLGTELLIKTAETLSGAKPRPKQGWWVRLGCGVGFPQTNAEGATRSSVQRQGGRSSAMAKPDAARASSGNEIPGPGTYNHSSDQRGGGFLGDAPCYTMGARKTVPRPDDQSPGPVYSPRMLTPRATGPIGDASQYSFGSSQRWAAGKDGDPGPGQYTQVSTRVGGSLLGDAPKFGFGTSAQRISSEGAKGNRFISKEHSYKSNYAVHSPGPLVYKMQDGLGTTMTGTGQPNSPRYTMRPRLIGYQPSGTSASGAAVDQPGPGTYSSSMAFGAQVHSARNSAASFSFGTSARHRPEIHPKKTQYIGKDYERQNWGIHSPGPMQYSAKTTIGPNADPRGKASAAYSFSSESRFAY